MNWQRQVVQFAQAHDSLHSPEVHTLDLLSELGEVAKEILLASQYGRAAAASHPNLAGELGDVLYSLCLLASAAGVDLETALQATLQKYEQRWQEKGHAGSRQ